jgi:hypothetical protein
MNSLARLARVGRLGALVTLALAATPVMAGAAVRKEGTWPASDRRVSLEFEGKPSEGLKRLADEAGWSLVVSKGVHAGEHDVKIDVADQPADAVLEALFAEADVVARRNGTLITVLPGGSTPATAPAQPEEGAASLEVPPPVPTVRGQDRNVIGEAIVVQRDEVVHTVTVTGGSAEIFGTVTGDLVVAGGSAKIREGGRVVGNATVFGGSLNVERGARVDGDVGIVGGVLHRDEGATIAGKVVNGQGGRPGRTEVTVKDGKVSTSVREVPAARPSRRERLRAAAQSFGQSLTNMALLFVFGCVVLALGTGRVEALRVEVAARPMRSFALGIVGALLGGLALLAVCVTVVGIPFAFVATLLVMLAVFASMAAVLTTIGAAVAGHKSKNPYVHLLVGCAGLLVVGLVPHVGGLVTAAVVLVAIGALISTRLAGLAVGPRRRGDLV